MHMPRVTPDVDLVLGDDRWCHSMVVLVVWEHQPLVWGQQNHLHNLNDRHLATGFLLVLPNLMCTLGLDLNLLVSACLPFNLMILIQARRRLLAFRDAGVQPNIVVLGLALPLLRLQHLKFIMLLLDMAMLMGKNATFFPLILPNGHSSLVLPNN